MTQLLTHPQPYVLLPQYCTVSPLLRTTSANNKRSDDFTIPFIRKPDNADVGDPRVGEEAVFDFERVDVFAATDDEIFDPAGDSQVAVGV